MIAMVMMMIVFTEFEEANEHTHTYERERESLGNIQLACIIIKETMITHLKRLTKRY